MDPHSGLIGFPTDAPHGYGVTRATLDPMVRALAADTPGVELLQGVTTAGLIRDGDRIAGVVVAGRDGHESLLRAPLVVGADGRHSTVARLAQMRGRVRPNNRFFYFAYWHGVRPVTSRPRLWLLEPEAAAMFPNEDDVTVLVAGFHRAHLADVRADPESAYQRLLRGLPEGPDLAGAERTSKLIGALDVPNVWRPAAEARGRARGRCRLRRRSAVRRRLRLGLPERRVAGRPHGRAPGDHDLDRALARYRRAFRRRLLPHYWQVADFASGRPLRPNERIGMRAAAATRTMRARSRRSRAAGAPRSTCSGRASSR